MNISPLSGLLAEQRRAELARDADAHRRIRAAGGGASSRPNLTRLLARLSRTVLRGRSARVRITATRGSLTSAHAPRWMLLPRHPLDFPNPPSPSPMSRIALAVRDRLTDSCGH